MLINTKKPLQRDIKIANSQSVDSDRLEFDFRLNLPAFFEAEKVPDVLGPDFEGGGGRRNEGLGTAEWVDAPDALDADVEGPNAVILPSLCWAPFSR